jgi:ankyrin repeat protein
MQKSPVYHFLELVKCKKMAGATLSFADSLEEKQTADTAGNYYLIPLGELETKLIIDRKYYALKQNHMSVYYKYQENRFGMTAYHYTAELRDNDRHLFLLHVYYDRYGNYSHHLLQRQERQDKLTVEIEDEISVIALSGQHVLPLICEINLYMDQKVDALSAEIRQLQSQCEEVSKKLFGPQSEKEDTQIRRVYDGYCTLTDQYHATLLELNDLSFEPDIGKAKCLAGILLKLKSGEILAPLLSKQKSTEKTKKQASDGPRKTFLKTPPEKIIEEQKPNKNQADNKSVYADEIKSIGGELKSLSAVDTVKALVRKFELINRYIQIVNGNQVDTLIRLFTQLDQLVLRAQSKIEELVGNNILKDVSALFKIAGEVSGKMVIKAAVANANEVLDFLLSKYKKNINLLVRIEPLLLVETLSAKTMEKLLRKGANPNVVSIFGDTALMEAARLGNIEKMRLLIRYKGFVNYQRVKPPSVVVIADQDRQKAQSYHALLQGELKKPSDLRTPLCLTILNRNLETTVLLLENGADPLMLDRGGFPAFSLCCPLSKSTTALDDDGRAFLHFLFTKARCNINMLVGNPGLQATLLHFAAQFDYPDYVIELLKLGADPNIKRHYAMDPRQSITAPTYCGSKGRINLLMLFIEHENVKLSIGTLAEIILNCNDNPMQIKFLHLMVKRFINETLVEDPKAINNLYGTLTTRTTMVHYAIMCSSLPAVKKLVSLGADLSIKTISERPEECITAYERAQQNPLFNLLIELMKTDSLMNNGVALVFTNDQNDMDDLEPHP